MTTTPTTYLDLVGNQISSIESGTFSGLAKLTWLFLSNNTALTELNLAEGDYSGLDTSFGEEDNVDITSVSLANAVVSQTSLAVLLDGGRDDRIACMGCNGQGSDFMSRST